MDIRSKRKILTIGAAGLVVLIVWMGYLILKPGFPNIISTKIGEVEDRDTASFSTIALSPDGKRAYNSMAIYYSLETGSPQSDDLAFKLGAAGATTWLSISPTGRFITGTFGSQEDRLLDLELQTFQDVAFTCKSWSRDGSRCIDIHGELFDVVENRKVENWEDNLDFRDVKNISGNGDYLWDNDRNIPIAHIFPCPERDDLVGKIVETWCQLVPPSVHYSAQKQQGVVDNLVEINLPSSATGWTFDPTGKYVLLAVWDRKPITYSTPLEWALALDNYDNVLDTRLLLINWKNKKMTELGRLSQLAPGFPVSRIGGLQWSANGSTILVLLEDYHFLVIKVRYP